MSKRKKKSPGPSDYGPDRRWNHHTMVLQETHRAGVFRARDGDHTPLDTLYRRNRIDYTMLTAGHMYSDRTYTAGIAAKYATMDLNRIRGGEGDTEAGIGALDQIRAADKELGHQAASILRAVCVEGRNIGDWERSRGIPVRMGKGETILKAALVDLAVYWGLVQKHVIYT